MTKTGFKGPRVRVEGEADYLQNPGTNKPRHGIICQVRYDCASWVAFGKKDFSPPTRPAIRQVSFETQRMRRKITFGKSGDAYFLKNSNPLAMKAPKGPDKIFALSEERKFYSDILRCKATNVVHTVSSIYNSSS